MTKYDEEIDRIFKQAAILSLVMSLSFLGLLGWLALYIVRHIGS